MKAITYGRKKKSVILDKGGRNNGRIDNISKKRSILMGKCFNCDKFGQMKRDSMDMKGIGKDDEDAVFAVGGSRLS